MLLDRFARVVSTAGVSHIHFIGGEKGGVGKSVMARLLAQYFVDRNLPFAGVDSDPSHGALVRHYGDFSQFVDLTTNEGADQILDRALGADRRVLVDLPAQSASVLDAWLTGANVISLAREMGTPITFWHVTDGGYASVGQLELALERYGDSVSYIVVKNLARSKDFTQLEASPAMRKLASYSGNVFELPELDGVAMYKIDSSGASYWAAANATDGGAILKPLERERVKLWLRRSYAGLEKLHAVL